ncbi:ACT domain-containing protein [Desulfatitalea alkaliphila]|uniref:ACT domain-containing protein n=1 Tax=Desulfatitalea alkaliphila TaxID=2929485 RepID=A0AA41R1W0_9BACT|nr:ACT domain-containing protein [Desulfatitalea alkaliphila]MCJ8500499.1 ACT domain-containing protein [Desulfatitalea alkaliphila]
MQVEQISVFLENKSGRLSEVTGILAEAGVNIQALALADTSDFGVLRLIVDDNEKAANALKDNGLTVGRTEVVAVEVEDRPGGLHRLLEILKDTDINVEYMYAYVHHTGKHAVMIFRFDNSEAAIKVLTANGVSIITRERLYAI